MTQEALTVELKDRSVNRNSVYNPLVKPRLLPCAAHWRLVCKLALGHKKLVVWEAVSPCFVCFVCRMCVCLCLVLCVEQMTHVE
jgi:hypothetical protein